MKFYKLLFYSTMIMGTLISISSYSWLGMWIGLEINLISIIPLFTQTKNMYSAESSIKYFLTQTLASMMILFSIIIMSLNFDFFTSNFNKTMILIMNSSLLTKMGAAPFHFWFPEVMEGLNWINGFILLTWQKIAPMILIMYNSKFSYFFLFIIMISMIISGIMGFNQISLRKILTFSSINHIGWMLSALLNSKIIWMFYFIIYSLISLNIILIFNKMKIFFINQLISMMNYNSILKLFFILNFFSLGGLPPFIGFLPKWFVINELINNNMFFISFFMILLTLFTLYFYIRVTFSTLIINHNSPLFMNFKINNFLIISLNFIVLSSLILFPLCFNLF
uniref:NADH dehydrogenase subunit 2 n=1 Tax=Cladiscus yunnanus TaxID=3028309 RepID=UPI0023D7C6F7|nr:NADH dehydrogenase subunit 2 [Cladiscus yunnanus]WDE20687.1 NADH dehydrogenase subunit 2 [Cladiscus yunnanus]